MKLLRSLNPHEIPQQVRYDYRSIVNALPAMHVYCCTVNETNFEIVFDLAAQNEAIAIRFPIDYDADANVALHERLTPIFNMLDLHLTLRYEVLTAAELHYNYLRKQI